MDKLNELVIEFSRHAVRHVDVYWGIREPDIIEYNFRTVNPGFVFPLKGNALYRFDGTEYEIRPGVVVHGGPGMTLDMEYGSSGMEFCLIFYDTYSVEGVNNTYEKSHFLLEPGEHSRLTELLYEIHASSNNPDIFSAYRTKVLFGTITDELFNTCRNRRERSGQQLANQIADYMKEHYQKPITMSDLAATFELDEKHLAYRFHKHTGISPKEFLIQYRMTRAKELLRNSNCSIKDIARSVGYSDAYYFSRLFKKHVGLSPLATRTGFGKSPS
ncbi:helix-turn-helix domain-containing protein [Paenibacillus sp. strain BS8-2]